MESIEAEGKTVNEAVESALKKTGLSREQVEVHVLQEPSGGFIGIGAKPARIRIAEKHWGEKTQISEKIQPVKKRTLLGNHREEEIQNKNKTPESRQTQNPRKNIESLRNSKENTHFELTQSNGKPSKPKGINHPIKEKKPAVNFHSQKPDRVLTPHSHEIAGKEILPDAEKLIKEMLHLMHLPEVSVSSHWDPIQERTKISLSGDNAKILVGADGHTLESLQIIFNILLSRKSGKETAVQVDAQAYWENREKDILARVQEGVSSVIKTGAPYRLPPMSATMRRMIHKTLANHADVQTASEGEGVWRKIILRPRKSS